MGDRYLITGATGFIGSNVVRALVARKKHVSILTRHKGIAPRLADIQGEFKQYTCDLLDPALEKVVDNIRPTIIFHFAAFGVNPWETDFEKMVDVNIRGTSRLLGAAKKNGFRLFVHTGTSSEYGVKKRPMRETDFLEPVNDYGVTKAAATLLCAKWALREHLPIVTFRPFSPYGYFEHKKRLFPSIVRAALSGSPILVASRAHVRDFIFIDDVVDAYMKIVGKKISPGEVFNISMGKEKSVEDVVKRVVRISHSKSKVVWGAVDDQGRQVEPVRWQGDITKAKRLLGWAPRTTIDMGIKKLIAWTKTHHELYD